MLPDHDLILGISGRRPLLDHSLELIQPVHLNTGVYGVASLIDHVPLAALFVVLHARRLINADLLRVLHQFQPVVHHGPTPLVAVLARLDVPQIIQQYASILD